ncbi:sensor domain-containing diguanylate cyclase [bacterium]|nr:sensor domain-containing diguanylate cyclase [bacterium]
MENFEKLSIILNESYNEKSLNSSLGEFFLQNFGIDKFSLEINKKQNNEFTNFEDSLKYPIFKHKKSIGSLCFSSITPELSDFLKIASSFISLKVQNVILNDKMQKNINFHETMKNIAKIIETQYELKYVIPIIGEMIDKFFENYLLYIYLLNENTSEFYLAWPIACKDPKIIDIIGNFKDKIFTDNRKTLALPLKSEGKEVGILVAKSTDDKITEKDEDYLEQLASQIATTINRANVYAEILKHATLDALTGFYNRRQLEERIKQEVANAKRQNAPLCGIMTDIDFFKRVNDTYGHAVGDLVLKTIAKIIRGQLREYDIAGRYGGEEFSILLPFTKMSEAQMVAERLRKTIESKVIDISKVNPESETKEISVTLSLGIYEMKPDDNDEDLLKKADKALYEAKNTGRNKVVIQND